MKMLDVGKSTTQLFCVYVHLMTNSQHSHESRLFFMSFYIYELAWNKPKKKWGIDAAVGLVDQKVRHNWNHAYYYISARNGCVYKWKYKIIESNAQNMALVDIWVFRCPPKWHRPKIRNSWMYTFCERNCRHWFLNWI